MMPSQELQQIEQFFGQRFHDSTFHFPQISPFVQFRFTCEDVLQGLRRFPIMKALAPPYI